MTFGPWRPKLGSDFRIFVGGNPFSLYRQTGPLDFKLKGLVKNHDLSKELRVESQTSQPSHAIVVGKLKVIIGLFQG